MGDYFVATWNKRFTEYQARIINGAIHAQIDPDMDFVIHESPGNYIHAWLVIPGDNRINTLDQHRRNEEAIKLVNSYLTDYILVW